MPTSTRHWNLGVGGFMLLAAAGHVAAAAERVLVIDQEGQTRPAFVQFMDGFRSGLAEGREPHVVFVENLDLVRLNRTPADPDRATGWLVDKYRDRSFDVIVPTSAVTRDFVLANRDRFAPAARIVAVERPGESPPLLDRVPDYTFASAESTIGATSALACDLFPRTRRIALISQSIPHPAFLASQRIARSMALPQPSPDG